MSAPSRFLSAREAAEVLGVSPATVASYCAEGLLPGARKLRAGSPWRIPASAVEAPAAPVAPEREPLLAPRNARSRAQQKRAVA